MGTVHKLMTGMKGAGSELVTESEQAMVPSGLTTLALPATVPKHMMYTVVDQEV